MSRIRLSAKFRAEWARILAVGAAAADAWWKSDQEGAAVLASGARTVRNIVARRICERWRAAGFTTVRLEDGLPRPERPHPADWQGDSRLKHCGVCGRTCLSLVPPATCSGPPADDAVHEALSRGVPFGLRDGLPTAGEPLQAGDVVAKLARATCRPLRRDRRRAA